jgi:hypothetical protein
LASNLIDLLIDTIHTYEGTLPPNPEKSLDGHQFISNDRNSHRLFGVSSLPTFEVGPQKCEMQHIYLYIAPAVLAFSHFNQKQGMCTRSDQNRQILSLRAFAETTFKQILLKLVLLMGLSPEPRSIYLSSSEVESSSTPQHLPVHSNSPSKVLFISRAVEETRNTHDSKN